MDLHYKQEVTVGLLVIAAIILFFAGLVWLSVPVCRARVA